MKWNLEIVIKKGEVELNIKNVIKLSLGLIIIGMLIPRSEVKSFYVKNGKVVKVKWIDGSISKLKQGKWVHKGAKKR